MESMNPNVNPCDNFYKFACGGFLSKTVIPEDEYISITRFTEVFAELKKKLREILEESIEPNEIKPFRLAKTLYKNCLNESKCFKFYE